MSGVGGAATRGLPPKGAAAPPAVRAVDLSVIIVNYNAGSFLEACLASIRRFGGDLALEIFVVDNASTDGSLEALRRFPEVASDPEPRANVGFAAAVNQGSTVGQGTVSSSSSIPTPTSCRRSFARSWRSPRHTRMPASSGRGSGIPTGASRRPPTAFRRSSRRPGTVLRLRRLVPVSCLRAAPGLVAGAVLRTAGSPRESRPVDYVTGACMLIRREVVDRIGGFDPRFFLYFEEKDFCLRAGQAGWRVWFDPAAEVVHHVGGSSRGRPEITVLERMRSMRQFYDKHYGWARRLGLRAILVAGGLLRCAGAALAGDDAARRAWAGVVGLAVRMPSTR